jgi:hypothetical protein
MKDENVHVKFVDAFLNLVNRVINLPVSNIYKKKLHKYKPTKHDFLIKFKISI